MKGTKNPVELSLLGLEKMLKQDINEVITEGKGFTVSLPDSVELTTRQMTREATPDEIRMRVEGLTPDNRVPSGEAPILVGVGFTKDKDGNITFGGGGHVLIAGNFASVFMGHTCEECAEAYNKAIHDNKKVILTTRKSAKGKWWGEFSVE